MWEGGGGVEGGQWRERWERGRGRDINGGGVEGEMGEG